MSSDLVSVVIPTHNYGHFVAEAVESVLAQTYPNYEILVVDDGSEDNTRQRLSPYLERIHYLYQDNSGVSSARNTGIRRSRGGRIAFLDADDAWHPRKLDVQVRYMDAHPEIGLLAAGHEEGLPGMWASIDDFTILTARKLALAELVIISRFGPSGVMVRRDCFDEVGLFEVGRSTAEDRDMWIRIAGRFPVAKLEATLWKYRMHGASVTKSGATARAERNVREVMERTFRSPEGRRLPASVKRRALSIAAFFAAHSYYVNERAFARALSRFIESAWLWPLPHARDDIPDPLARLKFLARLLLDSARPRQGSG